MHDWGYMRDRRIFMLTQHVEDERKMMEVFGKAGRLLVDDQLADKE
jgi:hypothetical protein